MLAVRLGGDGTACVQKKLKLFEMTGEFVGNGNGDEPRVYGAIIAGGRGGDHVICAGRPAGSTRNERTTFWPAALVNLAFVRTGFVPGATLGHGFPSIMSAATVPTVKLAGAGDRPMWLDDVQLAEIEFVQTPIGVVEAALKVSNGVAPVRVVETPLQLKLAFGTEFVYDHVNPPHEGSSGGYIHDPCPAEDPMIAMKLA